MEITSGEKWKTLLKATSFFSPFDDAELDEFLKFGEGRKYRMHEYVIREKDPSSRLYIILRGRVSIVKDSAMQNKTQIGTLEAGYVIGEIATLLKEKRTATIIASEETFMFTLESALIENMSQKAQTKFYKQLAIYLAKKLKAISLTTAQQTIWLSDWYKEHDRGF
ncbi:MAG: cyclic nucleotide-binding domain-containing protein [Nitrospinota bacterium]|nr:cyclic nucleotide-binding domain-containing protein [Nitrospinota bacterium]